MNKIVLSLSLIVLLKPMVVHSALKEIKKPKLVVMLMIDQFRADYLQKYKSEFIPKKYQGGIGGFNYLMGEGAYYPYAQYDVLQSLTGVGHATVLTGSYPYLAGIVANSWHDHQLKKEVNCIDDFSSLMVGVSDESRPGKSPVHLIGSTLGDELKNADYQSKVISIALKDRASILMGGHRSDLSIWYETKERKWVSSSFYLKNKQLPDWILKLNTDISKKAPQLNHQNEFPDEVTSPAGVDLTTDAVLLAIDEYKLGQSKDTDILAVSFTSHDYVGHLYDSNGPHVKEVTFSEDKAISKILNALDKKVPGGLENVVVVLSADHGVAPKVDVLQENKINAGYMPSAQLKERVEKRLAKTFGKLTGDEKYLSDLLVFNLYLNQDIIKKKKLDVQKVEEEVKKALLEDKNILFAFSRTDYEKRILPPGMLERQILKTYFPGRSGDVVVIPRPFFINTKNRNSHMTSYSYDKTVPLILMGSQFKKGIIPKIVEVVDIAPTLAFLLGVVPPSLSEGRVLSEAFNEEVK